MGMQAKLGQTPMELRKETRNRARDARRNPVIMLRRNVRRGPPMKLIVAGFVLAVLSTVAASIGFAVWDGHFIQRDPAVRAIHYDTKYDLSAQRRQPAEPRR